MSAIASKIEGSRSKVRKLGSAAKRKFRTASARFGQIGDQKNAEGRIPKVDKVTEIPVDPKLAVIVPAYNVSQYLEDCVKSIVNQSYTNWEMVIINDGSVDATGSVADQLAAADGRITVIHQENRGLGAARNVGIHRTKAPYMTFIDSDDLIAAEAFSLMMESAAESGSDVVIGSIDRFNSTRSWVPFWVELVHNERRLSITAKELPPVMWDVFACNKIFKRKTWDEIVGKFPTGTLYEDQECTAKLFVSDAKLDIIPETVYHWRHREDGQSITQQKSNIDDLRQRIRVAKHVESIVGGYTDSYVNYWYEKCLGEDFYYYYREVPRTSDGFFEVLQEGIREFYDVAPSQAISNIDPPRRWLAYLAAHGTRDQMVDLLVAFDTYRTYFTTDVRNGQLSSRVPELDHIFDCLPESLLRTEPSHFQAQSVVTDIDCDESGSFTVSGFGYVPSLDADLEYSVVLRNDDYSVFADCVEILEESPGALTRDPYNSHLNTKFSATFSGELIDATFKELDRTESDQLDLVVQVHLGHHTWEIVNPKRRSEGAASWPAPSEITPGGHRVLVVSDPSISTRIKILTPRFGIRAIEIGEETVHISGQQLTSNRLPNHDRFDLSDAYVRIRSGQRILGTGRIQSTDSLFHGSVPLAGLGRPPKGQFSSSYLVEVVCGGKFAAPLAVSQSLVGARDSRTGNISVDSSGFGYLQITRDSISTVVDSVVFDEEGGQLVVCGLHHVDSNLHRTGTPNLSLVGTGKVVESSELNWRRDGGAYVAKFKLPSGDESAVESGKFVLQNLQPSGQATPATLWVGTTKRLEELLPIDLSTGTNNVRLSAIGKSRTLQLTFSAPGVTRDSESAFQQRSRAEKYFSHPTRTIERGTVLFESFGGKSVSDSPKEIDRELAARYPTLRRFWSVVDHSVRVPEGATPLVVGTDEWMHRLATSSVIINNNNFPHYFRKSNGQFYIQAWHGTPLKKIGNDVPGANLSLRYRNLMVKEAENEWDLLLAQSPWAARQLSSAFGYSGPVFDGGYPRNDFLSDQTRLSEGRAKVLQDYGIDGMKTIVLYAPTWRDYLKDSSGRYSRVDFLGLAKTIQTIGKDFVVLYRGHANSSDSVQAKLPDGVVDVSKHSDVNELMAAADMMITDYSSIMFDFVVTGKPIAFLTPDLERYRDETRGFYFDFEKERPGPIFRNAHEAISWIQTSSNGAIDNAEQYVRFIAKFASKDDGGAARRFVEEHCKLFED